MTAWTTARLTRLSKEGSWIVLGQAATVAGTLVLVGVLTSHLDSAQFGQLALGLTISGLVNQVVTGGIAAGISRFYAIAAERRQLGGYMDAVLRLVALSTAVVLVLGLAFLALLSWLDYSNWIWLAAGALAFSLASGYNNTLAGIQNAARQRAVVAIHSAVDAWLKILLAVFAVGWLGNSAAAVVLAYTFSSVLVTCSQLLVLRSRIPARQTDPAAYRPWMVQVWAYSWPFSAWGIFTWAQQVADRWALQTFASTSEVGQYAVLFQLGFTPVAMVTGMATLFLAPILYQRAGDTSDVARNASVHRTGWQMTHIALLCTLACCGLAFALHGWIFRLLVAPEYRMQSYLLPWVVSAGGIFAAGQMLALKSMSAMQSTALIAPKIGTALVGIVLHVVGAALAGITGVVAALNVFSVSYLIWLVLLDRRKSPGHALA